MTEINSIQDVFDGIDSFITNRTSEVTHTLPDHEVATCDAMAEGFAGLVDSMTADTFAMTAPNQIPAVKRYGS